MSTVRAYVINLARSPDRRRHITRELKKAGLDYEIVEAVDGRDLDLSDTAIVDPSLPFIDPSLPIVDIGLAAGTAGAALSHLRTYRKIIADGLDEALVLEDDVRLPPDLSELADAVTDHLVSAEVVLLSFDSPDPCRMSVEGSIRLPNSRMLALPIDLCQPTSAAAYIVTRKACERLVEYLQPIRVQPDAWWFFYREGLLDRVRCVVPLPVRKDPSFASTIGSYSLGTGLKGRLAAPLVQHKIPFLHQALRFRRQRIFDRRNRSELVDVPFVEKPSRLE